MPPEIRTCDRRSGKLTQSCRPFRTSSDYPFGLLRGTERSESSGALHNTLATDCGGTPSFDGPRQLSPVIKRWPPIRDLWTALRRLGSPLTNY